MAGIGSVLLKIGAFGDKPEDDQEQQLRHRFLIYMGILMSCGGILWGVITAVFHLYIASVIPFGYTSLTILNFIYFYFSKNFKAVRFFQVLISLLLPFFFQWSLGGFIASGAVMLWATLAIVGSLTFDDAKSNIKWLALYSILTVFTGFFDHYVHHYATKMSSSVNTFFFVINIVVISIIVFGLTIYLLSTREQTNIEIKKKKKEIEELLEQVEQKVEERTTELKEKNYLLQNLSLQLSKYLSPQVFNSIFSGNQEVKHQTKRKKLTIFFSDIVDFTSITDSMDEESVTTILNDYLDEMSEIAIRHGGTIDKFIGDSIMIFFGDPETNGETEDALACVKMALEMRERMNYKLKKWKDEGRLKAIKIRMGINSGFCTVGNFGSESRLDYTIIGGAVNLASRLEKLSSANKILISQATYSLIREEIYCVKKDEISVKGIAYPVQTFEVVDFIEKVQSALQFKDQDKGYNLSIDVNKANKKYVIESLEQALAKLKES